MQYRKFGLTEQDTSVLGFGCMRFPVIDNNISKIDEIKASEMLRVAIDNGLNYIDTAYTYHGEQSELFVGKVLKQGYRGKVFLATKLPAWLVKTEKDMETLLHTQLERLQTKTIDFYLVHALTHASWKNMKEKNVFGFLDKAIADGKIKFAGFSFHDDLKLFKEIVDAYNWSFCQIQYNYLDEDYQAGKEGLDYAAQKGLGIVIMEPLRGGNLANSLPKAALKTFAKARHKKTPVEWALSWLWNHPNVHVILSGMSSMEQVEENLKYANEARSKSFSEKDIQMINEVKTIFNERIQVNCTACDYCMPCPEGINIPKNFTNYNNYFLFDGKESKAGALNMYKFTMLDEEKASNCVQCRECESKCPQNISIADELAKVEGLFSTNPSY